MRHWQWQSLVLSGLAHSALVLWPVPAANIRTGTRSRRQANAISEFSVISRAETRSQEVQPDPVRIEIAPRRREPRARPVAARAAGDELERVEETTPAPEPEPVSSVRPAPARTFDLSPLSVARSVVDLGAPSAGVTPGSEGAGVAEPARHGTAIRRALADVADLALSPRVDGSFVYNRNGLHATIDKRGDVAFSNRPFSNPALLASTPIEPPPGAVAPRGRSSSGVSAVAKFSLDLDFSGPHKAERRWFMDRTRALRDELAARARTQSLEALSGVLEQIWSRGDYSFAERRRRTFEAWDALADDELGDKARSLVTRFVRKRCPPSSGCAYDSEELARLNQDRHGSAVFDPYLALADAGR